ncbi:MAG: twin-arginine translocation pathway signal protein, partial [Candidatus Accumulibacter sp.]|nr:twin-arginine translocation pathway signal protein [Accumulibacter sp.]
DGVCSLHCAAISLAVNVDREPKTIWVADNASIAEIKPPLEVDQATLLIGSQIKDLMTKGSKIAYSSEALPASGSPEFYGLTRVDAHQALN